MRFHFHYFLVILAVFVLYGYSTEIANPTNVYPFYRAGHPSTGTGAQGERHSVFEISTCKSTINFTNQGDIVSFAPVYPDTHAIKARQIFSGSNSFPSIYLSVSNNRLLDSCIQSASFSRLITETEKNITVTFLSDTFYHGLQLKKNYVINKNDYAFNYSYSFISADKSTPSVKDSIRIALPSKSNSSENVRFLAINENSRKKILYHKSGTISEKNHFWLGIRDRFWSFLVNPDQSVNVFFDNKSVILSSALQTNKNYSFSGYCGPIISKELRKVDPVCTKLLYPLWFWMRWLSFGMLFIFNFVSAHIDNVTLSLVLLSICVKVIIAPFYTIANKWQKQVNEQHSLIQPRLDEIKKKYKGEEQTKQTLAAYKELGISPMYSLKSLLSAAIQIPIFFAAYHMLSENIILVNSSFLWIKDLSLQDQLIGLPFTIPLLGNHINILPFVMTSITFASSWLHSDISLSPELQRKQRTNLYVMAGLFFVLLYTSPAGMVIYWTMNNALAFLSTLFEVYTAKNKPEIKPVNQVYQSEKVSE